MDRCTTDVELSSIERDSRLCRKLELPIRFGSTSTSLRVSLCGASMVMTGERRSPGLLPSLFSVDIPFSVWTTDGGNRFFIRSK